MNMLPVNHLYKINDEGRKWENFGHTLRAIAYHFDDEANISAVTVVSEDSLALTPCKRAGIGGVWTLKDDEALMLMHEGYDLVETDGVPHIHPREEVRLKAKEEAKPVSRIVDIEDPTSGSSKIPH